MYFRPLRYLEQGRGRSANFVTSDFFFVAFGSSGMEPRKKSLRVGDEYVLEVVWCLGNSKHVSCAWWPRPHRMWPLEGRVTTIATEQSLKDWFSSALSCYITRGVNMSSTCPLCFGSAAPAAIPAPFHKKNWHIPSFAHQASLI